MLKPFMCYTTEESLFRSDFCKLIQQSMEQHYMEYIILFLFNSIYLLAIQKDHIPILDITPAENSMFQKETSFKTTMTLTHWSNVTVQQEVTRQEKYFIQLHYKLSNLTMAKYIGAYFNFELCVPTYLWTYFCLKIWKKWIRRKGKSFLYNFLNCMHGSWNHIQIFCFKTRWCVKCITQLQYFTIISTCFLQPQNWRKKKTFCQNHTFLLNSAIIILLSLVKTDSVYKWI